MDFDIAELMREARSDPSLASRIDVAKMVKHDFLENQTFDTISLAVFDSLCQLPIDRSSVETHCKKLVGYRFVDELHLLHKGKYVRWIRHDAPDKLTKGAVVVDIQFGDFGAHILCRLVTGEFLKYRFDNCYTYQKLSDEEQLILMLRRTPENFVRRSLTEEVSSDNMGALNEKNDRRSSQNH